MKVTIEDIQLNYICKGGEGKKCIDSSWMGEPI